MINREYQPLIHNFLAKTQKEYRQSPKHPNSKSKNDNSTKESAQFTADDSDEDEEDENFEASFSSSEEIGSNENSVESVGDHSFENSLESHETSLKPNGIIPEGKTKSSRKRVQPQKNLPAFDII